MAFDRPAAPINRPLAVESVREALRSAIDARLDTPLHTLAPHLGGYRGYAEMLEAIDRLSASNPERKGWAARLSVIGTSAKGEPIFGLYYGTERVTGTTRTSIVLSGLHPSEWIGIETTFALLDRVAREDLGDRSLLAVPIANPDGVLQVEQNLRAGRRRFVRHNARGVDLNRNFDARWGEVGVQRLLPWLFSPGTGPASEPEVEAIAQTVHGIRIDRAVSLHSFGGVVLYPSATSLLPVHDAAEQRAWAQRVAKGCAKRPYRALPCSWFAFGARTGGLELDWFHDRHGAISLVVECSRGGIGVRPSRFLEPFAWFNPRDPQKVAAPIADALLPFVRGDELEG